MAAAYLFHIVQNHPFVDGNKRVGSVAAGIFLELNGHEFNAPPGKLSDIVFGVAQGKVGKSEVALFLKQHC